VLSLIHGRTLTTRASVSDPVAPTAHLSTQTVDNGKLQRFAGFPALGHTNASHIANSEESLEKTHERALLITLRDEIRAGQKDLLTGAVRALEVGLDKLPLHSRHRASSSRRTENQNPHWSVPRQEFLPHPLRNSQSMKVMYGTLGLPPPTKHQHLVTRLGVAIQLQHGETLQAGGTGRNQHGGTRQNQFGEARRIHLGGTKEVGTNPPLLPRRLAGDQPLHRGRL